MITTALAPLAASENVTAQEPDALLDEILQSLPPAAAQSAIPSEAGAGDPIRLLVLSDAQEVAQLLVEQLEQSAGISAEVASMDSGEALRAVGRVRPDVLLVSETLADPAMVVDVLDGIAPGVPVITILAAGDARGAEACSLAGARVTLFKPIQREHLTDTVRRVHAREARRREQFGSANGSTSDGQEQTRRATARIIAVHGARGGVGTTTLACNLAAALRAATGARVALVDADVLNGAAAVVCDVESQTSLCDVAPRADELDADLVSALLVEHSSGVRVLCAPEEWQSAEAVRGEDVQRVLVGLKPHFEYQVVDTASQITPATLAALDAADVILHVTTPDIAPLRSASRFLQLAARLWYPVDKVHVVLNRATSSGDFTPDVVREYLERAVMLSIPEDVKTLRGCAAKGQLIVTAQPKNELARGIVKLAESAVNLLQPAVA